MSRRLSTHRACSIQLSTEAIDAIAARTRKLHVRPALYASIGLVLFHPLQLGWSISQLNSASYHDVEACATHPIVPGTCTLFPGHTELEWTYIINAWVLGGMIGSLGCGTVTYQYGHKRVLMVNAFLMITSALIQAFSPHINVFVVGRFIAGIVSGVSMAVSNEYLVEIPPPHLRNQLGVLFQIAVGLGIVLCSSTFFFLENWRIVAGIPSLFGAFFILVGWHFVIPNASYLLEHGYREEAELALARVYGYSHVAEALLILHEVVSAVHNSTSRRSAIISENQAKQVQLKHEMKQTPWKELFSPRYRQTLLLALSIAITHEMSGINVVLFYSSSFFSQAGLQDGRVGNMIVSIVNLLPCFVASVIGMWFGTRKLLIGGHIMMFISTIGLTYALITKSASIAILCTALSVAAFGFTLGSFSFVVVPSLFPDQLRATGMSFCTTANWTVSLVVLVVFPYVSQQLQEWSFLPFMTCLFMFGMILFIWLPETGGKTSEEIQFIFRTRFQGHPRVQPQKMTTQQTKRGRKSRAIQPLMVGPTIMELPSKEERWEKTSSLKKDLAAHQKKLNQLKTNQLRF